MSDASITDEISDAAEQTYMSGQLGRSLRSPIDDRTMPSFFFTHLRAHQRQPSSATHKEWGGPDLFDASELMYDTARLQLGGHLVQPERSPLPLCFDASAAEGC